MNGIDFTDPNLPLEEWFVIDNKNHQWFVVNNKNQHCDSCDGIMEVAGQSLRAAMHLYDHSGVCMETIEELVGLRYKVNISIIDGHVDDMTLNNGIFSLKGTSEAWNNSMFVLSPEKKDVKIIEESLNQYVDCYKTLGKVVDESHYNISILFGRKSFDEIGEIEGLSLDDHELKFVKFSRKLSLVNETSPNGS
ncbi:hypothetical protein [Wolbachia endosymbiont of Chironomus riparius]|uniref:hypothetical protein n=1 Tax=Wolbachia endosymbiont of Chironomus riparius TaxID=2883238 RepID=UPI00209D5531|nr:hypothetical protein [Wolbachia endosymbiont of Chironomus riparius]